MSRGGIVRTWWLIGAVVPTALCAAAPDAGSAKTRNFVEAAASINTFEQLETDLVLNGTQNAQTRAFAQRMSSEHAASDRALANAAAQAGLQPPKPAMSEDQAHLLAALQGLKGPDLDQAYSRQQVLVHSSALATMQHYAADGDASPLKRLASAAVPALTSELSGAQQLMGSVGAK